MYATWPPTLPWIQCGVISLVPWISLLSLSRLQQNQLLRSRFCSLLTRPKRSQNLQKNPFRNQKSQKEKEKSSETGNGKMAVVGLSSAFSPLR
jgi:hypothetical protein